MLKITRTELLALSPCNPQSRLKLFGKRKTLDTKSALAAGATIRDVLWVAAKLGRKDLCIKFALVCTVRAEKFDKTGTALPCNKATADYIKDPSATNLDTLRKARYAADAADYASAAAAAAYAAYAASAASAAAAYAASAAAAAAAAAYTHNKEIAMQKKLLIQIFGG